MPARTSRTRSRAERSTPDAGSFSSVSDRRRTWIGLGVVALVALAVVALPDGDSAASFISLLVQAAFYTVLAIAATRAYRDRGEWLSELPERNRGILYGAISIGLLAIIATPKFGDLGFGGILLEILILGACIGAAVWVWRESRRWIV